MAAVNEPASLRASTLGEFALVITRIGLTSFGGGLSGWMLRFIVHEKGWLDEGEFLSGLALCQVFPGVNVVNLSVWLGYRLHGSLGALIGALAIIVPPALVIIAIAAGFREISGILAVKTALNGVGAAAVGLTGSMGVRAVKRTATSAAPVLLILTTILCIVVLRLPLVPVVIVLAAISITLAFRRR